MNKLPPKANPFVLIDCNQFKRKAVAQDRQCESPRPFAILAFEEEVGYIGDAPMLARVLKDETR
ncbi:hypothetical protein [Paraburkholderia bannensis]|uniref:hypothetical protein n=1 Tax=Paraburkholderia bannensis TaxID=765414 RepID=UPI002AB6585D|nr:hypothetical protein [Paraburkholderia bannensis]